MLTWLVYDISADKARTKVARLCKDYGLSRVQKSAFFGEMDRNRVDELALRCKELIDAGKDAVYIFPMCEEDFRKVRVVGKQFEGDRAACRVSDLFI